MNHQPIKSPSKIEYLLLSGLLVVYGILALAHSYLAPLTTGPDELAHFEYMSFITEHGRLPADRTERSEASYKSDQPPLYHLIAALPASLPGISGPPTLKRVNDHPRRQLIERARHAWGLYNTEDEQWPYRGEVMRWHVGRWVAIFFGTATILVTFFVAREMFDSAGFSQMERMDTLFALSAAAIVAFTPRFILTGSMLNYETLVAFITSLFLWVLLRIARYDHPSLPQQQSPAQPYSQKSRFYGLRFTFYALFVGLMAGLAIVTKLSALILPVEMLAALGLMARFRHWSSGRLIRYLLLAASATLAGAGWWFGFVLYRFNTVANDGWWTGLLRPLIAADASDATTNRLLSFLTGGQAGFRGVIENLESGPPWEWAVTFFRTFWVVGIEGQQPLGLFGLIVALGLCLLAAVGLIGVWGRHEAQRLTLSILLLHLFLPLVLPLIRYMATLSLADTAQGRHALFLAAPAFAILLVWGLRAAASQILDMRIRRPAARRYVLSFTTIAPGLFLLFWSGIQLWTMSWAYLPPLPVQTLSPDAASPEFPGEIQPFNDFVVLRSSQTALNAQTGMLQVELWWEAIAISPVDYVTELTLRDGQGEVRSEWIGYPAEGRYPTRAWDPGDFIRDTIWLPVHTLEPGDYQLSLNLLAVTVENSQNGTLAHSSEDGFELDTIMLGDKSEEGVDKRFQLTNFAEAAIGNAALWQAGVTVTEPALFRYRESILVTFSAPPTEQGRQISIIGSTDSPETGTAPHFAPVRQSGTQAIFIVGPDWTTGSYRLQIRSGVSAETVTTSPLIQLIDRWERTFEESSMEYQVGANFGNQIKLLGYDLPVNRAQAGGGIPVTLYWQGLDWMGDDYTIFTKLLAADQMVHGGRDRLPREGYRTLYWAPGEIIIDPFGLPVDTDAPDGVYYLNLGLYKPSGAQAHALPLVQDGQPIDLSSINIGPIKIGDTPLGIALDRADPQVVLNQSFGDKPDVTLLGYDLADEEGTPIPSPAAKAGADSAPQSLRLTLYWRSEAVLPIDYTTFVHVRDDLGEIVAQKDQPPLQGAYPSSLWDPGEIIADEVIVPLPPELKGAYRLVVGLYDFKSGLRLSVPRNRENEVTLADMEFGP